MDVSRQVVSFLSSRGLKLATAESCTAGEIASELADVPGSGACLDVGFVTYSPTGKAGFLGVRNETMELLSKFEWVRCRVKCGRKPGEANT